MNRTWETKDISSKNIPYIQFISFGGRGELGVFFYSFRKYK